MDQWTAIALLAAAQIAWAVKGRRDRAAVLAIVDRRHAETLENIVAQVNLNNAVGECLKSNAEVGKLLGERIGALEPHLPPMVIKTAAPSGQIMDLEPGIIQPFADAGAAVADLTARLKELEQLVDTLVSGRLPDD